MKLYDYPIEDQEYFFKVVDELIMVSQYDQELKDGLEYLDHCATLRKITIYEMIFYVFNLAHAKLDDWRSKIFGKNDA